MTGLENTIQAEASRPKEEIRSVGTLKNSAIIEAKKICADELEQVLDIFG